jgi:hypothetical protein
VDEKMPSIETNFGIFHILSFLHVMDDQVLNEDQLVSDSNCNILQINDAQEIMQELTSNGSFTFTVGVYTIRAVHK